MSEEPLRKGQRRRHRLLGSHAVYRVVGCDGDVIRVEVEHAPGLAAGAVLRFSFEAVREMELLESPLDDDGAPPKRAS
jgi:hypothetical protein